MSSLMSTPVKLITPTNLSPVSYLQSAIRFQSVTKVTAKNKKWKSHNSELFCREHARCLPYRVHPQRQDTVRRATPEERHSPGMRRFRRPPSCQQAKPSTDHVPLHQWLHCSGKQFLFRSRVTCLTFLSPWWSTKEFSLNLRYCIAISTGCRHGGWHQGAAGYVLCLLRCSVHHAPPDQVRRHARREDAEVWRHRVARQHRLVRWKVSATVHCNSVHTIAHLPVAWTNSEFTVQVRSWQADQAAVYQEDHRRHPLRWAPHRQLQEDGGVWPGDPHWNRRHPVWNPRPDQHRKLRSITHQFMPFLLYM